MSTLLAETAKQRLDAREHRRGESLIPPEAMAAVHASLDLGEVLQASLRICSAVLPSEVRAEVFLLNGAGYPELVAWVSGDVKDPGLRLTENDPAFACLGRGDEHNEVGSVSGETILAAGTGVPIAGPSWLIIPLAVQGKSLGALVLSGMARFKLESIVQGSFLTFIEHLALAVKNAQKFRSTHNLAITDGLTGVYNRQYLEHIFEKQCEMAKRCGEPLGVLMADLDGLKEINDVFGHAVGDLYIKAAADVILGSVRGSDWVFRYGGDEFVVLLPKTTLDGVQVVETRLRRNISSWNEKRRSMYEVIHPDFLALSSVPALSLSIGIASAENPNQLKGLLKEADLKMYANKKRPAREPLLRREAAFWRSDPAGRAWAGD